MGDIVNLVTVYCMQLKPNCKNNYAFKFIQYPFVYLVGAEFPNLEHCPLLHGNSSYIYIFICIYLFIYIYMHLYVYMYVYISLAVRYIRVPVRPAI